MENQTLKVDNVKPVKPLPLYPAVLYCIYRDPETGDCHATGGNCRAIVGLAGESCGENSCESMPNYFEVIRKTGEHMAVDAKVIDRVDNPAVRFGVNAHLLKDARALKTTVDNLVHMLEVETKAKNKGV